jgi:hypothetical protein
MTFTQATWGNHQPSIEIRGQAFSEIAFSRVLKFVCNQLAVRVPAIEREPAELNADIEFEGTRAFFHMDAEGYAIAFMSVPARDRVLSALARFPTLAETGPS